MNVAIARLVRAFQSLRPGGGLAATRSRPVVRPRRSARWVVGWFVAATVGLNVGVLVATDSLWPRLRDPEYGRRAARLHARIAENPGRPLVLALGSSRAGAGVKPTEWEAARPGRPDDPMVFNMGQVGAGPLMQLLTLHRLHAEGIRPAAVLVEYWPPFLSYDDWPEWPRVEWDRLYRSDLPVVREHFRDPEKLEHAVTRGQLTPVYSLRRRLLIQVFPAWFAWPKRFDVAWNGLDGWGWLPGLELPAGPNAERARRLADCEKIYTPGCRQYTVHPEADRNLRAVVALAREHGAKVAFYYLPESAEFRGWYSPGVTRRGREHLAGLSTELGVPVIDAREWADDFHLVDGFHLSRIGAAAFTRKLVPAVREAIHELGVKP